MGTTIGDFVSKLRTANFSHRLVGRNFAVVLLQLSIARRSLYMPSSTIAPLSSSLFGRLLVEVVVRRRETPNTSRVRAFVFVFTKNESKIGHDRTPTNYSSILARSRSSQRQFFHVSNARRWKNVYDEASNLTTKKGDRLDIFKRKLQMLSAYRARIRYGTNELTFVQSVSKLDRETLQSRSAFV